MSRALTLCLGAAQVPALFPAWRRFARAAARPEQAQLTALRRILAGARGSAFFRDHRLERATGLSMFRSRVPLGDHDSHRPYIERICAGEPRVLCRAPVRMVEPTSGSAGAATKLIPYTDALLREFSAATDPWIHDLYRRRPALIGTRAYWSVSPVARAPRRTAGGLPLGFDDDTRYFGPLKRAVLSRLLAAPPSLARIPEMDRWRRETCLALLRCADLGLISVWSPTFLSLLMEAMTRELEALLSALPPARAAAVRAAIGPDGALDTARIWPRLRLISCWADGASAAYLPELRRRFSAVEIQPKGLLASEGVVSFPLCDHQGAVLAVAGHFLEFVDLDQPGRPPLLAHQLRPGGDYAPLLTTGGGLYRYRLGDHLRCLGRFRRTPLVRFVGKIDAVSDLCGEKLSAELAGSAIEAALARSGVKAPFALIAPHPGPPAGYVLYLESEAPAEALERVRRGVEAQLCAAHHYRYSRDLGQLQPLTVRRVKNGWARYQRALEQKGVRPGDIKPTPLDLSGAAKKAFEEP